MKRGKRGASIKAGFSNRWLYILIAVLIVAGIGIGVYALSPGVAPNPGHLISDVAPPAGCASNQVLQWNGNAWTCTAIPVGAVTKNNWCVGDGSAVQCNQNAPPTKGQIVYFNAPGCGGGFTTASTCRTSVSCGSGKYLDCTGMHCYSNVGDCTNSVAGYLVN